MSEPNEPRPPRRVSSADVWFVVHLFLLANDSPLAIFEFTELPHDAGWVVRLVPRRYVETGSMEWFPFGPGPLIHVDPFGAVRDALDLTVEPRTTRVRAPTFTKADPEHPLTRDDATERVNTYLRTWDRPGGIVSVKEVENQGWIFCVNSIAYIATLSPDYMLWGPQPIYVRKDGGMYILSPSTSFEEVKNAPFATLK